jgi:hypothetical protein
LLEWKNQYFSKNRLGDTTKIRFEKVERKCTLDAVSPEFYNLLKKKFNNDPELIGVLNGLNIVNNYNPSMFIKYIEDLDHIRNTNWRKILPELASVL